MLSIQYNTDNFNQLLPALAGAFKIKPEREHLTVFNDVARGYCWSYSSADGITAVIMDLTLYSSLQINYSSSHSQLYLLSFVEATPLNLQPVDEQQPKQVLLDSTAIEVAHIFKDQCNHKAVIIFFEKKHLLQLLDEEVVENILSQYFANLFQKGKVDLLDTDYRMVLQDLLVEKINHPLRHHYLRSRILLLIEKFLEKNMQRNGEQQTKFSDSEINRLMKVESLLTKDYSIQPPTIEELSRLSAMSPTKLKKDFKTLYGLPIYEYFQKGRMLQARTMLLSGDYSVKQVGIMVGYTNLSHFAASFKKEFGVLPSELFAQAEA